MRLVGIVLVMATPVLGGCSTDTGTGPGTPASVQVSASKGVLVKEEAAQLAWEVKDRQGATLPNEPVTVVTNDASIATVTAAGVVTGIRPGTVTIAVKAGQANGQTTIVVEEGGMVSGGGGTVSGFGGAVELTVPAGAVANATAIRFSRETNPLLDPTAVAGSIYGVSSEQVVFAVPARLRVRFDPSAAPVGLPVSRLGLRRFTGSAWVAAVDRATDPATNHSAANVSAGGSFSVGWVPPSTPCSSAEYRDFDFWLGAWAISTTGPPYAQSDITEAEGRCAILEHYRDNGGTTGRSISFYEPTTGQWYQTYVDNQGSRLLLGGAFAGGAIEMLNPPGGGNRQQRWRWTVEGAAVRQEASLSTNGGASYNAPFFSGLYSKR